MADLSPTAVNAERIRTALKRIECLWDASLYPDKVITEGLSAASEGSRPPIPIGGVSLRADIARRLHHWADLANRVAGHLPKLQHLSNLSAIAACRYWADWLAQDDAETGRDGAYLADEMDDLADKLAAHTIPHQPVPNNVVGNCPLCDTGTLAKAGDLIECDACGKRAEPWQWWERRFPDLQRDVTQQDIAAEYDVPPATVRKWVERNHLRPRNPNCRPLRYAWAEVRWAIEYRPRQVA